MLEDKPAIDKPARNDATALENQLGLRPHEDGADLQHPPGRRQADRHPSACRSSRMNSAFGSGFGEATLTAPSTLVVLDQPAYGLDEILVVDPRHVLPAIAGAPPRP